MEKYNKPITFQDYISEITECCKVNLDKQNSIGRVLRSLNFKVCEIVPNSEYFKNCYDSNESPEYCLENLKYNENELFRKLDEISDEFILDEVDKRCLGKYCLDDVSTYDLESEIEGRWDQTYIDPETLSDKELEKLLKDRGFDEELLVLKNTEPIDLICRAIGLYNSYAWTKDEIIEAVKKIL